MLLTKRYVALRPSGHLLFLCLIVQKADQVPFLLQLSKYPTLNNLERQAGVPKTYAVIGVATLYFFFIVFNLAGQLLTNLAGFVIPGYYSLEALFSSGKSDDTQWLTVSNKIELLRTGHA